MATSWRPEVIADDTGKWIPNGLRFATKDEAYASADALMMRWFAVREIRAAESEDPVNSLWNKDTRTVEQLPKDAIAAE